MANEYWDTITGLGEDAYNYVTDINFGDTDSQGTGLLEDIGSAFQNKDGSISGQKVSAALGGITNLLSQSGIIDDSSLVGKLLGGGGGGPQVGYQGEIPKYTASRMKVPGTYDPNRRPGSAGQRYFTDVNYNGGDTSGQAAVLKEANLANPAQRNRAGVSLPAIRAEEAAQAANLAAANNTQALASGGIAGLGRQMGAFGAGGTGSNSSGMTQQPRYLSGSMDGMADTIPASIDGKDPAALSGGEFVVPADIVSGLGNGNSDAGAKNLYAMMDKIRQARTGMKKQPPAIDPNKMLPNMRA